MPNSIGGCASRSRDYCVERTALFVATDAAYCLTLYSETRIGRPSDGLGARPARGADIVALPASAVLRPRSIGSGPVSAAARTRLPAFVAPAMSSTGRTAWADFLQRVFEIDALHCPACGGRMRIPSAITDPGVARRILECLDMPSRAPPLGKPKGGSAELLREESAPDLPGDVDPGFDFDQSHPDDS